MSDKWGPWIAHVGTEMPSGLNDCDEVQTWRVDYSEDYLPEGKGSNHEEGYKYNSTADEIPWHNPPGNKMVVAYRVKKEPVVEVHIKDICVNLKRAKCTYTDGKLTKIHWEAE